MFERIRKRLFSPIDGASLVIFRIVFPLLILGDILYYFDRKWIDTIYILPSVQFPYQYFEWVVRYPGNGFYYHYFALCILAIFVSLGLFYRVSAFLFALGLTYTLVVEKCAYLNHLYLICLISFLFIFLPLNRSKSLDALIWPKIRSEQLPFWALWILRFQVAIPYFFGALVKLNSDWLAGQPLTLWLQAKWADCPSWVGLAMSWGGILFDFSIVGFLLFRKTRIIALAIACAFHLFNAYFFEIAVFPWLMIAASLLFFPPEWPRRWFKQFFEREPNAGQLLLYSRTYKVTIGSFLGLYVLIQLLVPLRPYFFSGHPSWTGRGDRFSWRMKLNHLDVGGRFYLTDPKEKTFQRIATNTFLPRDQRYKMLSDPRMTLHFAKYLKKRFQPKFDHPIEIRATVMGALNGREKQLRISPEIALSEIDKNVPVESWLEPLRS